MMASPATRHAALVILVALILSVPALAAGPVFDPPLDNTVVRGTVVVKADKHHLDGADTGYISYQFARQDMPGEKAGFAAAVMHPFEYTWDTQEMYFNPKDPWDPFNGSRKYPDGQYTVTAVAFSAAGEQLGDPATATVSLENSVPDPPLDGNGRLLLRAGGSREEELRYQAVGRFDAQLANTNELDIPLAPPTVSMLLGAEWREVARKPNGPGHTPEGKRYHGQLTDVDRRDATGKGLFRYWRPLEYGVRDEYPERAHVELLGYADEFLYDLWRDSANSLFLTGITGTAGATGGGGGGGGAAMGGGAAGGGAPGAGGGAPGMAAAGGGARAGGGGGAGGGMAAGGGGGMPGGGAGMPGGGGAGAAGGVAAVAGTGAGTRGTYFMPINLPGLGRKYRSVITPEGYVGKMQEGDPRWALAEQFIALPGEPKGVGETWYGPIAILPFLDKETAIVTGGPGTEHGPAALTDLYCRHYTGVHEDSLYIGEVGGGPPVEHVLDGFEYYDGYECARIVTRYRNYVSHQTWRRDEKMGWWLSDLQLPILGTGQANGGMPDEVPMVRTDLTRVTYFAYRSGHVVGIQDHYYHQLWLNKNGYLGLSVVRRTQGEREGVDAGLQRFLTAPVRHVWDYDNNYSLFDVHYAAMPATFNGQAIPSKTGAAPGGAAGGGMPGAGGGPGRAGMPGAGGAMPGGGAPPAGGQPGMGGGQPGMPPGGMAGGGQMGQPGAGGAGGPGGTAGAAQETMIDVIAHVDLKIQELNGSDELHPRQKPEIAALPPADVTPPQAPGARESGPGVVRRYVVVEDTGVFYLPSSKLLEGQAGVPVDASADQLVGLGYKPAADLKFER